MASKRVEGFLFISIIALYAIGQSIGAVDGAIAFNGIENLVDTLTGDPLYNTIFLGASAYAIFGVLLFFFNPFPAFEKKV